VKQRLLNLARSRGDDFNLLLTLYGIERLLYRLSCSSHGSGFVLKGAMLFQLWTKVPHRPTRDVDLLGSGAPELDGLETVFRSVCTSSDDDDDGLEFLPATVRATRIRDDAEYEGIRIRLESRLGSARIPLQVDVGFGDEGQALRNGFCGHP
jgi:hypothetical protein